MNGWAVCVGEGLWRAQVFKMACLFSALFNKRKTYMEYQWLRSNDDQTLRSWSELLHVRQGHQIMFSPPPRCLECEVHNFMQTRLGRKGWSFRFYLLPVVSAFSAVLFSIWASYFIIPFRGTFHSNCFHRSSDILKILLMFSRSLC